MVKLLAKKSEFDYEKRVIKIGYCQTQYLLRGIEPIAYTRGTYGWNADIYQFNRYYIVTGYRPFGKIEPKYEDMKKYEYMAEKIWNNNKIEYGQKIIKTNKLLNDFILNCCK